MLVRLSSLFVAAFTLTSLACASTPTPEVEAPTEGESPDDAEDDSTPAEASTPEPGEVETEQENEGGVELDAATKQALAETIRGYLPELQACYETELAKNPKLVGKMTYTITVERTGSVRDVDVDVDTVESEPVRQCTIDAINSWKFDGSDLEEPADVTFSIDFKAV